MFLLNSAAVKPSCHYQAGQCGSTTSPCQNGGACTEGWNRALCDCSSTLYNGPTCGRESATLAFNGSQHMAIKFSGHHILRTQTEELVLRFKTPRASGLLLLVSAESEAPDRLEIALVAGRVRASMRLGGREKVNCVFSVGLFRFFFFIVYSWLRIYFLVSVLVVLSIRCTKLSHYFIKISLVLFLFNS